MRLETLYEKLPILLQNAVCSAVGWRTRRTRLGFGFRRYLEEAEERMEWSEDRILSYRDQRLREFVGHCARTVPYYGRLFAQHGIDPNRIRTLDDLKEVPILTKEEVQHCYPEMLSEAVPRRERVMMHTSGTTGGGLRFATTVDALQQRWAIFWRYRRWHRIELDDWHAYFGGRSVVPVSQKSAPFWRYNLPGRQILFSGYHVSAENLPAYVAEIRRRQPPWLHGYPSLLVLLAAHLVETHDDLGYQVGWVTVGAENLLSQQAKIIERGFGVRPRQHYGMAEGVANVSECEQGRLHVDEDYAAVEFLPNTEGPGYRVIGTNFTNPATPLLRYDVQDIATLSDGCCACGRPGRIVEDVDGRREDYVVLKNGVRVGRMDHILKDLIHIREAQVYQKRAGEIIFRVLRGSEYGIADEKRLLEETRNRLGDDTEVHVQYVDHLPRSREGKLRFVVSDLDGGRITCPAD